MRSAGALGVAFVAALPLHWELLRYPEWFVANNLYFSAPPSFDWTGLLRQIWWATEILVLPWRWFNDYGGLTNMLLALVLWVAWRDRTRAGFYAWATVAIVLTLRFNSPQLGLIAGRQLHLLPVLVAPALAGFIARYAPGGPLGRAVLVAGRRPVRGRAVLSRASRRRTCSTSTRRWSSGCSRPVATCAAREQPALGHDRRPRGAHRTIALRRALRVPSPAGHWPPLFRPAAGRLPSQPLSRFVAAGRRFPAVWRSTRCRRRHLD